MSEQVLRNGNVVARSKTRTVTQIAMLGAIAGILMNLEFPLPFLAPTFYQLDFSEIPVLVGSFAMGPIAGVLIELVKILCASGNKGLYDSRCRRCGKLHLWMYICSSGRSDLPL